jgi:DNA (cytosine-5)-methyltransferase 1
VARAEDAMSELRFIDLFCGIGGFRMAFERAGCRCVFSCDRDKFARKTYAANFGEEPAGDITQIDAADIPDHDILCAGFPCQPFSIAGRQHGFACPDQGNMFFEIVRVLREKRPAAFVLENVKNLKGHDKCRTFDIIRNTLVGLGYYIQYKVIDSSPVVPQKRKRIFIVGFCKWYWCLFDFPEITGSYPKLGSILEQNVPDKYTMSDNLWQTLLKHAERHKNKGNGFGFGLFTENDTSRTLTSRYCNDGSEILISQEGRNPRRLTPRECARLMGFPDSFVIPVSDTQAYKQFGNSVVVPVVERIAKAVVETLVTRRTP